MAKINTVGSNTPKNRITRFVVTVFIVALTIFMVSPFIWMVSAALKKEADVMTTQLQLIPGYFYPDNFLKVLGFNSASDYHFVRSYWNSIKVGVLSTIVSVSSSVLAGYAFAKLKFKGSGALFILYLSQMMIPSQLTLIPRFVIFSEIGLTGSHWSLILPKIVSVSSTFMMRQAFLSAPDELRESAKIDGAGEFRIFLQIMTPMVMPSVAAIATVQFMGSWNSYMDPLIFISNWRQWTLPLALNSFVGDTGRQYGLTMAACCMATIPVFIVFLSGQKFFLRGLTVGAVKG
ncbi:MAG: carbohydrate ABC transporter permease [Lachnospiraceae bacterium]|nr:carbohydrate ABC transporter permease [Lachnospiraceae bacterium]